MTEQKIVTPLGFAECTIEIDSKVPIESLRLMRTYFRITAPPPQTFRSLVAAIIGQPITVPLRPGKYTICAVLGNLVSEPSEANIEDGQVVKIRFFFGKEP